MKSSIATVSISGTLREKLIAISQAGFDAVEILEQDFIASDLTPRELAYLVKDNGLKISLFHPFRDFEGLPEPHRSLAFSRAKKKFELMNEMGAELILFCSTVHPKAILSIDRMAEDFHQIGRIAKEFGIRIGFEALAWGTFIFDHRDAWELVRRVDHPNVGLILDSFHSLARGIEVETIKKIPKEKIFFVQLSDAPGVQMDYIHWARHHRTMPGEGDLDVAGFTRAVIATGYDGYFSLEILNDRYRAGLSRPIAIDGHRSLIALLDQVRRADASLQIDLPRFPPPQLIEKVEFIEFATNVKEAPTLEHILQTLGFTKAGRHKSKSISLWRQAGINILVNITPESFASSSYSVHGTSVAEVAFKLQNAQAALERAKALDIPVVEQSVREGEASIPAIRGVSGSLIRLLDGSDTLADIWNIDFYIDTDSAQLENNVGLIEIDHINQTVSSDDMLGWGLFYSSLFQTRKSSIIDVVDSDGLIKSQAIESGALRVTLNGTDSKRTLAGRFVEETFGASVQHIALRTLDIFQTAERLKILGFETLEISRNYFDDVELRFGLDLKFSSRLREYNIMYDEDENGSFLQFYSKTSPDRFFFEVVQRNGTYSGYGAANAPYRTAAQKRLLRPYTIPQR